MGIVYAARNANSRVAAVKVVLGSAPDPNAVARFVRETQLTQRLTSDHVVRVESIGTFEDTSFMIMELLDGESLNALVGRFGAVPHESAVDWIHQACLAVGEAHAAGIVHRDLKPGNIFLARTRTGSTIKVLDFGLAKLLESTGDEPSLTAADLAMGTPHVMSPEQFASARDVDARTDVWALGTCLHRLLTGHYPFDGSSAVNLFARITTGPPDLSRLERLGVPPRLRAVIARCLMRIPEDRYDDARMLARALEGISGPRTGPRTAPMRIIASRRVDSDSLTRIHVP